MTNASHGIHDLQMQEFSHKAIEIYYYAHLKIIKKSAALIKEFTSRDSRVLLSNFFSLLELPQIIICLVSTKPDFEK